MPFPIFVAVLVGITVICVVLSGRPRPPKASALGDLEAPTAEEGGTIPVIFGTVKMSRPNVTWYGDLRTEAIKVRSGLFSPSWIKVRAALFSKTTIGYKYFLGMQLALCHGYIAEQGTHISGSGSGHVAFYDSTPMGNWFWGILWSDFPLPDLPEDAVVQAIYAVARSTRITGPGPFAYATIDAGQGLNPWGIDTGGIPIKWGASDWDGTFYGDMGETSLDWLATAGICARLFSTLTQHEMDDDLFVTALGFAVYYTSSEPVTETGEMDPPVSVPEGQGIAWTYPATVEARPGSPGADNGLAEGVAATTAYDVLEVYAGQHPDDVLVPTEFLEQTDDFIHLYMNAPELFGGERREGGLQGQIKLYRGSPTQESDPYLSSKLGLTFPAYRGLCYAVLEGCYLGTSNYLKNLNFVLRRFPSNLGLSASVTRISGDANPVEMIYEAMTNTTWGLGRPAPRFDLASWRAAAIKVASESLGISLTWDTAKEAQDLIEDILGYIDGVIQTDPQTGLWIITLAREDYNPDTLLELGDDDQLEAPEFTRGSWEQTWNQIKIEYIDRGGIWLPFNFKTRIVQADDSANHQVMGAVRSKTLQFLGITRAAVAQQIAKRELRTYTYPFAQATIKAKRKA
jgi:hypothetical protein